MDFDPDLISAPFRMQPGLRRLGPNARHLTPLSAGSPLWREKKRVLDQGASRHAINGFDSTPALRAIARCAGLADEAFLDAAATPLELAFEEDFAVLEGDHGTLPWLCVCLPSHWAPEAKLGLPLTAVHAPVADNALLQSATPHLVELATSGQAWERFVWTVSPSARYDQHPVRQLRTPWPETSDARTFAQACCLRVERQTFFPVGQGTRQAVFTIRVMLQPLATAVRRAGMAHRLHAALASMSSAALDYKGLTVARDRLLHWLVLEKH